MNAPPLPLFFPRPLRLCLRRLGRSPGGMLLIVSVQRQRMEEWTFTRDGWSARTSVISTSRYGIGQQMDSFRTPLGLHRVAVKVGGGQPVGTVFLHRRVNGRTWQGQTDATICHRILWLDGLEPGLNRGGQVDTFRRYVYIHGYADETTLGRPKSRGCIHVAGADLLPLFDRAPVGTLVWIQRD